MPPLLKLLEVAVLQGFNCWVLVHSFAPAKLTVLGVSWNAVVDRGELNAAGVLSFIWGRWLN
jgi:hypothetical protein